MLSLRRIMARERVSQTKQVQVRDDVRESYTSSGALQLRTATTAPEAWVAMDSCFREGARDRKRQQRANASIAQQEREKVADHLRKRRYLLQSH